MLSELPPRPSQDASLILAGHQPRLMLRPNQVIGNQLLHPLILRPPSETFAVQDTLAHHRVK